MTKIPLDEAKLTPGKARGIASRLMMAEDASWAGDIVFSSQKVGGKAAGLLSLLLTHHFVRIAFEGGKATRSGNPWVGTRELAALLNNEYSALTARVRNVTKLMDDTKKGFEDVLADLDTAIADQQSRFLGHSLRIVRFLERDLGLYFYQGKLVGTTMTTAYRLRLGIDININQGDITSVTREWGGTLAVLLGSTLNPKQPEPSIGWSQESFASRDERLTKYCKARFEQVFPESLKLLLMLIEGDLNASGALLAASEKKHKMPVFRARVLSLYHGLTTLKRVADRFPEISTPGMTGLREILASPEVSRIFSREGKLIRNRCVHYEMNDPAIVPDFNLPMFGLIKAVYPSMTWHQFNDDVISVTENVASHLGSWGSSTSVQRA